MCKRKVALEYNGKRYCSDHARYFLGLDWSRYTAKRFCSGYLKLNEKLYPCSCRGVVERKGRWWCSRHDPVLRAAREEAKLQKRAMYIQYKEQLGLLKDAKNSLIEAVENAYEMYSNEQLLQRSHYDQIASLVLNLRVVRCIKDELLERFRAFKVIKESKRILEEDDRTTCLLQD